MSEERHEIPKNYKPLDATQSKIKNIKENIIPLFHSKTTKMNKEKWTTQ
jgi:zona occludens toxin (predicted ATPase)